MSAPALYTTERIADAAEAWRTATSRPAVDEPISLLGFIGRLDFLVTVGQLTESQANALITWFQSEGQQPLPALPDPMGVTGLTLYQILRSGESVFRDHQLVSGTDTFFGDLLHIITEPILTTIDTIGNVLDAATTTLHAATSLVEAIGQL